MYLDLNKAFDTVDHTIPRNNLEHYVVRHTNDLKVTLLIVCRVKKNQQNILISMSSFLLYSARFNFRAFACQ